MHYAYVAVILLLFLLFFAFQAGIYHRLNKQQSRRLAGLTAEYNKLSDKARDTDNKIFNLEKNTEEVFVVYEAARDFSSRTNKDLLISTLKEKLQCLGKIEDVKIGGDKLDGYLSYQFQSKNKVCASVKTDSGKIRAYFPVLMRQFALCYEKIELYERMQYLSIHDDLTQLANRRYFMRRFYEEFDRAKRLNLEFTLLMCDIDFFKLINDTHGHIAGDLVLRDIALILKSSLREIDFVARTGGEEFAMILSETDKGGGIMVGERIVREVALQRFKVFGAQLGVTVSIGVATYPHNTVHSDMLFEISDKALYKAKQEGRNRVGWF